MPSVNNIAVLVESMGKQDAEKVRQLRSQLIEILNGDPAASRTRRRAQTWCSLFVAPCAPKGTPPGLHSLRPCWTIFLSILQERSPLVEHVSTTELLSFQAEFGATCSQIVIRSVDTVATLIPSQPRTYRLGPLRIRWVLQPAREWRGPDRSR